MNTTLPTRPLLAALLVSLAGCGGGGSSDTPPEGRQTALAVSRPGQLAGYVQERLRTLDSQGRLASGIVGDGTPTFGAPVSPVAVGAAPSSRTLVQEDGVDEPDLIQTDGRSIYTLQPSTGSSNDSGSTGSGSLLQVYGRGSDGRATRLTTVALPSESGSWGTPQGMVFSANQQALAVVSSSWSPGSPGDVCPNCLTPAASIVAPGWMRSSVQVQRVNVADPGNAAAGERVDIDGHLIDSRRIGDKLYVVTQHRPALPDLLMSSTATAAQRQAAINSITAADLLPRVRRNGGASRPLLADTDCYLQNANASTSVQLTTVTVFDLNASTLPHTSRCFVGGSEALYMTTQSLYIATSRWQIVGGDAVVYPAEMRTDIHKFALDGGTVTYRASGDVPGHLGWDRDRKSYRLSEHAGHLRVLSYTGATGWWGTLEASTQTAPPSPATLSVLRENAGALQTVATLPNSNRPAAIGKPGEQVYGVRFVGDRGYVVTFRRIDPLYVLDLSNPADPKTVGELEIAGFSDYLFPLPNGLLLGVGKDADSRGVALGVKVALFDVSNPAQPSQRSALVFGTSGSASAMDYSRHGLNLMMNGTTARLALPVHLTTVPWNGWQRGLQRLEVDTAARSLTAKALLAASGDATAYSPLWLERAAQVGDQVYHLNGANLATHDW
jgi:Beta propeller domain